MVLGTVVSFALDVPWASDVIGERLIWPEVMLSRLREFFGLAGRARTSGESIYCWI